MQNVLMILMISQGEYLLNPEFIFQDQLVYTLVKELRSLHLIENFKKNIIFVYHSLMQLTKRKLRLLAKGANSQVYLYSDKGVKAVLKLVPASCPKEAKHLANEYEVLSKLKHDNIIKCLKYKQNINLNGTSRHALVLEYATEGSLLNFMKKKKLLITEVRSLVHSLAQAISYLHCNYIFHRDLKLQNVLVTRQKEKIQIKLSDFGFATKSEENGQKIKCKGFKGTRRGYMAPEIHKVLQNPQSQYEGNPTDIFSFGVILFALAFNKLPFEYATGTNQIYQKIAADDFDGFWQYHKMQTTKLEDNDHSMVQDLQQLIFSMLKQDPSQRPTIKQILNHPWLQGFKSEVILA